MTRKQAPEPGSPIANLQKAAKRAKDESNSEAALQAEGARLKALIRVDSERSLGQIANATVFISSMRERRATHHLRLPPNHPDAVSLKGALDDPD